MPIGSILRPHITSGSLHAIALLLALSSSACGLGKVDADLDGWTKASGDCDDSDPAVYPGSTHEECSSGRDYNCDDIIGTRIPDGGSLPIDVRAINVGFEVTLDGEPISEENTSSTDYGRITLQDALTGESFEVFDLWDLTTGAPVSSITTRVLPGVYNILYTVQADGPRWPDNHGALLMSHVALTADQQLALDIRTVAVTFNVTLNGQPLSTANTGADDEGSIELRDLVTGDRFKVFSTWNDTDQALTSSYTARLIPGTYDVLYAVVDDGPHWPANQDALLEPGVVLATDQSLAVDVPVAQVTFDVTLNGQGLSSANSGPDDEGAIALRSLETGDVFRVFTTWDDSEGVPATPFRAQVIPGRYDVLYAVQDPGAHWPLNDKTPLKLGIGLTADQTLAVDVPSVAVALTTTLGGEPLSSDNSGVDDEGALELHNVRTGETFSLFTTWSDALDQPNSPHTVQLIPATYDLYYSIQNAGGHWPLNQDGLLKSGLELSAAQDLAVDVPFVSVTFDVTLDGQPVTDGNTSSSDYGGIALRDSATGSRFHLFDVIDPLTGELQVPYTARVLPGTYDIDYSSAVAGVFWPVNKGSRLAKKVQLTAYQTVDVDVPVSAVTLELTLNGQPVSSQNSAVGNAGLIELRDTGTGNVLEGFSVVDATTGAVAATRTVPFLPGSYDLLYSGGPGGESWPAGKRQVLSCFETP